MSAELSQTDAHYARIRGFIYIGAIGPTKHIEVAPKHTVEPSAIPFLHSVLSFTAKVCPGAVTADNGHTLGKSNLFSVYRPRFFRRFC